MKKIHTLVALTFVLASTSAGCGFLKGGSGHKPAVAAVEPSEENAGATVTVTLENFNEKRDILLFGGVPVRVTDPEAVVADDEPTGAKSFADSRGSKETPDLTAYAVQTTVTRTVTVPNLDGGPVALTVRRGDYESDGVSFTILSSNSQPKDDTSVTAGSDTHDSGENSGDSIQPNDPGAGATAGGTTGTTTGGTTRDPAQTPPAPHAAFAQLTQGPSSYNYIRLNWSVAYVDAAFIRVPVNYSYADVISFGQYMGHSGGPFPFGSALDESGLLEKLAGSLLDDDHGNLPFNYCAVPAAGRTNVSHPCYTANPNTTAYNYVDIMIPLASGEKSKSGTWKFRVPKLMNTFSVFYRDWSKTVHRQDLKIAKPF